MNTQDKKLCSFTVSACIYDLDLASKVNDKIQILNLSPKIDMIYRVKVSFNKKDYYNAEFYKFPVERKQWQIEKLEKFDENEKRQTIINEVLSAQLQNVCKELKKFNITYRKISMIGDDFGNLRQVKIEITEDTATKQREEIELGSKKSKTKPLFRTIATIIPDQPYINDRAAEVIADLYIKKFNADKLKELEKSKHTPNLISTERFFNTIANAIITEFTDKYVSSELLAKRLLSQAILKNDWPLEIVSKEGTSSKQSELENEIDCLEYLIYIKRRHSWILKKIQDLEEAKQIILTEGYNRKFVEEIIVLHNLKIKQFDLFVENRGEIIPVEKLEAHTTKKLFLRWK